MNLAGWRGWSGWPECDGSGPMPNAANEPTAGGLPPRRCMLCSLYDASLPYDASLRLIPFPPGSIYHGQWVHVECLDRLAEAAKLKIDRRL